MASKFIKKIEDFECENCGEKIRGNGFTNHCPKCLWSKHVDINPGDRESSCGGLMRPVDVFYENGEYVILHKCLECPHEKRNKMAENDNFDQIIKIIEGK